MLHKMKFIIRIITAPGPKIKQNYNHIGFKGKIGSHMHLKHCQVGRGWAGAGQGTVKRTGLDGRVALEKSPRGQGQGSEDQREALRAGFQKTF